MATPTPKQADKTAGIGMPLWKNKNVRIGAVVAALALVGGTTYALWPHDRDKEVAAAAAKLAGKSPEEVRKVVESGQIPREVAWEAMGQAREAEMQKRMDTYFALKTPVERTKYLDQMINEMEAMRKQWEARASTQPSMDRNRGDGRRGDGPTSQPSDARRKEMEQRRAQRQDAQPPEKRAQRAEFMVAMRKRMQERGIQMGGPGGGRGMGFGGFGGGPRGGGGGGGDRGGR